MDSSVDAPALSDPDVSAGGAYTTAAGGVSAICIAKWDGSSWSALGSGLRTLYALAVIGSDIYAGGDFTTRGGVSANYIARWDGSNWFSLNSTTPHNGMDYNVYALKVS